MNKVKFSYGATGFAAMAHRGGAQWAPNQGIENTLRAFQAAVSLGYRYIETDVQASADAQVVCFHDPTLDRVTDGSGRIGDHSLKELADLRVGQTEPIPLFDDVVEALPETLFNVDLKTDDVVEPLVELITRHHLEERILVDSFSQRRISRFRALTKGRVPTAMAPPAVVWTAFVPLLSQVVASPALALQVPVSQKVGPLSLPIVTAATIKRIHRLRKLIHVWTINDPAQMHQLIDLGVDGIITDCPDVLKAVLIERNLWTGA